MGPCNRHDLCSLQPRGVGIVDDHRLTARERVVQQLLLPCVSTLCMRPKILAHMPVRRAEIAAVKGSLAGAGQADKDDTLWHEVMMLQQQPRDIALLMAEWQFRALIRAQLIEEGFNVVGTDTWTMMRRHLRPGSKPRFVIVDLKDIQNPREILNDLRVLMDPNRVLVLTAIGTVPAMDIEHLGFRMLSRPIVVRDIVETVTHAISPRRD
jgi:hypothetical protein